MNQENSPGDVIKTRGVRSPSKAAEGQPQYKTFGFSRLIGKRGVVV
jgi:hypothetical protein